MRLILVAAVILSLAACTTPAPKPEASLPAAPTGRASGSLVGLAAGELSARLGQPVLQIREGQGLKLQYRSASCVLDAYLYPPAGASGPARVTHVDTRNREGANVALSACLAALEAR